MTKTHVELTPEFLKASMDCNSQLQRHIGFLEELKQFVLDCQWKDEFGTKFIYAEQVTAKIEQFQAEQKVGDEK